MTSSSLLDDLATLRRMDRSDMLGRAAALSSQVNDGYRLGLKWSIPRVWGSSPGLLVCGVGGSAIGGDLLQGILGDKVKRPISVNRTYTIPAWVNRQTLVLACSYSGNTEETLTAVRFAAAKGARIVALTSGGKLALWAGRRGFPLLTIPPGLPPRAALGYQLGAPLGLLSRIGWIRRNTLGVEEAAGALDRYIEEALVPRVRFSLNPAKRLAQRLKGRLPILYSASGGWEAVSYRWRTQLEENAKTLAFHHLFPEATHNEISGWLEPKAVVRRSAALFLMDPAIHPRIRRRMTFTAGIIQRQGALVLSQEFTGGSILIRILKLIALGDFVSVYLGLLYRVDPTPVQRVEALKRFLK